MGEITFRPFNKNDIQKCSRFAADAWPQLSSKMVNKDITRLMKADLRLACYTSTWLEVACDSDDVVGFLFARVNTDFTKIRGIKVLTASLVIGIKTIIGSYGRIVKPFTFLKKTIVVERKAKKYSPKSDAEVEYFVVDSKYRGKGIGKALMDRFISNARAKGVRTLILCTDQQSNWQFYEKYGFKRYNTFIDDLSSYCDGEDVDGYIYSIEIEEN